MFFDMSLDGNEILVDEFSGLPVLVRLGIQPSTSPSCWCRAEVEQNGPVLLFRGD